MSIESVYLEHLTWMEAEKVFKEYDVVVIPLGARTKEHGPHLPLNNDWIMAEYLTSRVAEQVHAIIVPTLQYGYYPSFTEYPGSVTLGLDTSKQLVKDLCISLSRYGVKKFYVLNTGISTNKALAPAKKELEAEGITLWYTDLNAAEAGTEHLLEQEGGTHADESETSMMLYIKPEIVDMRKAAKDYHPLDGRGLTRNPENKNAGVYSATGIYGDPSLASVEKGKAIVESLVQYIVEDIKKLEKG
jgi:creatinine amidohydrolase